MTGFKGTRNENGRPKGAVNKTTTEIREHYQKLVSNNLQQLDNDLKGLEPLQRLKMIIELSKFVVPTLKATELTATGTEDRFDFLISPEEIKRINAELEAKY